MTTSKENGVILIFALWVLVTLSLISLSFAYHRRLELEITEFRCDREKAYYLAQAGVNLALTALRTDVNDYDALNEPWHLHPVLGEDILRGEEEEEEEKTFADEDEETVMVSYSVIDEEGKLNINLVPQDFLDRLPGMDEALVATICDWRDPDTIPSFLGAEQSYYQNLNPPYLCKDGFLDIIEELLLVKGMTSELFYGEVINGSDTFSSQLQPGLCDLLTVYSDGHINLNTAPLAVLQTIPGVRVETAEALVQFRTGPDGTDGTEDDTPFTDLTQLKDVPEITDYEYYQLRSIGTLTSRVFTIKSTAVLIKERAKQTIVVVAERAQGTTRILSWSIE